MTTKQDVQKAQALLTQAQELVMDAESNLKEITLNLNVENAPCVVNTLHMGKQLTLIEEEATLEEWADFCKDLVRKQGGTIAILALDEMPIQELVELLVWKASFIFMNAHDSWRLTTKLNYLDEKFNDFSGDWYKIKLPFELQDLDNELDVDSLERINKDNSCQS